MHKVGKLTQLQAGDALSATIDGVQIALFLVDGRPVATAGTCPHAGGPLAQGELCDARLTCPWHGWAFNLRNGQCEEDPDLALPLYQVRVEGDDIFVAL